MSVKVAMMADLTARTIVLIGISMMNIMKKNIVHSVAQKYGRVINIAQGLILRCVKNYVSVAVLVWTLFGIRKYVRNAVHVCKKNIGTAMILIAQ